MENVDWGMFILLLGTLATILMGIALCIGDDDAVSGLPPLRPIGQDEHGQRAHHV